MQESKRAIDLPQLARDAVLHYVNGLSSTKLEWLMMVRRVALDEVQILSFEKNLQNWKALVETTHEDSLYFEVIYDGTTDETTVTTYRKIDQVTLQRAESFP